MIKDGHVGEYENNIDIHAPVCNYHGPAENPMWIPTLNANLRSDVPSHRVQVIREIQPSSNGFFNFQGQHLGTEVTPHTYHIHSVSNQNSGR